MRIAGDRSIGLIVDMQERLLPHMAGAEEITRKTGVLIRGLAALGIPMLLTEQYPRGLGPTVEPIAGSLPGVSPIEKIAFSCCDEPRFLEQIQGRNRPWIIIAGIEAHVCVLQTAIDLAERGFTPVVVADCVSSRNPFDVEIARSRMAAEGVLVSTGESILFELCRFAGNDTFKAISKLVK
ncbi:isochorismatase family protein [Salinispira pacifica]